MKVLIEAPFNVTDQSKLEIEEQVKQLQKLNDRITQAEVYFKTDDGNKHDVVLAEVHLHVPGPDIFGSETNEQFMAAFTGALGKAKRQLLKAKSIRKDY